MSFSIRRSFIAFATVFLLLTALPSAALAAEGDAANGQAELAVTSVQTSKNTPIATDASDTTGNGKTELESEESLPTDKQAIGEATKVSPEATAEKTGTASKQETPEQVPANNTPANQEAQNRLVAASDNENVAKAETPAKEPADQSDALLAAAATKYDTPLAAGTYMIATGNSTQRVLDVSGGSKANGANVILWDWHNAAWQKWAVSFDKDGLYTIINAHSGKPLDVSGAVAGNGRNVLVWENKSANNANQRWILEKSGTGFILKSALNHRFVLDCTGNSAANGTNIEIWQANGGANQLFNFVNLNPSFTYGQTVENGIYTMGVSNKTSQLVEVQGNSARNCANIDLYVSNSGMNQRWSFQYNGAGLYKIINVGSGLALDVEGANPTASANVLQYAANGGKNQLWAVQKNAGTTTTYTLYSALNGLALDVAGASTANLANLATYYPNGNSNQRFALSKVAEDYSGTYSIYSRLSQDLKAVDIPEASTANGVQPALWTDNQQMNQHFVFEKVGSAYSIRPVSSGKYLTVSGGKIVQTSGQGASGAPSNNQLWTVSFAGDGFQIRNIDTSKVMSVAGSRAVNSAKLQEASWSGSAAQKFLMRSCEMLPRGLYAISSVANAKLALDASGASFNNGTNAIVWNASGNNNQKYAFTPVSGGYYRVTLALGGTVLGVTGGDGASVKLYNWSGADSQLWKPVLVDGGFSLQNKASGMMLAAAGAASGNDVVQKKSANAAQQKWRVTNTAINLSDMGSFVQCLNLASGSSSLTATRAAIGFSTSSSQWKALQNALAQCWNAGIAIGFVSVDCNTGMTLSVNADRGFYGASTIKGLYITYLCEELLEKGALSLGQVQGQMHDAIVYSDNYDYMSLRYAYGSQEGFNAWLAQIGVGGLAMWDTYSPRTLAKAWVHMLEYENSGGRYVGFWRSIFDHSDMSTIKGALGGYRTVYSKPGWMDGGTYGTILDDGGIVKDGARSYVLAVMTSAYPYNWQKGAVENVVRAIDGVHSTIPVAR